ncbi:immunoglobulin A1 protease domain protein [Streptococcus pneumoniae GA13494]|nr:immunoglobulin A1 protease domain protein [Streptococcus pneumoniae GA13494]
MDVFDLVETSSVEFPFDGSGSVCPFSDVVLPEFSGFVAVPFFSG